MDSYLRETGDAFKFVDWNVCPGCATRKSSAYSDFLPKYPGFPAKAECTVTAWKSALVLNCKSDSTSVYVQYRQWLLNLAQIYSYASSAKRQCEPWDGKCKHSICTSLNLGFFFPFAFFKTLFHYLQWKGMPSETLRNYKMPELLILGQTSLLSLGIIYMEIHSWTCLLIENSYFQNDCSLICSKCDSALEAN